MHRKSHTSLDQKGLTIVELTVVIVVVMVLSATMYGFFNGSFIKYFKLQQQGSNFGGMAAQSQRLANVLRGLTDIVSVSSNDLTVYAYFAPSDTYVSKIRYYENPSHTALLADVTRMTSNPPVGTPIDSTMQTYTIISNFYQVNGVNLFNYLDANNNVLAMPIADQKSIKAIQINLAAPTNDTSPAYQSMTLQVSLRNRKTNL